MATDHQESDPLRLTAPSLLPPRSLGSRHRLVVWVEDAVKPWGLPSVGRATVGRAPECDIQVSSPTVSRRHAQIEVRAGAVFLTDLSSHNGTRVNGERIETVRALTYGDIISFGEVTAAFVEEKDEPASGRPRGEASPAEPRTIPLGDRTALVADPAMLNVYNQLELLAPSDLTVLVLGETGTGKELAASALHHWSKRRAQPLVTINCASLPDTLAESELFGHERGAFSGAVQAKPGLLESAPGGTVFLDEIGDLSLAIQAKLLRVLETRRLTRLGSVQERRIDIRVVAATHRDLAEGVRSGRFREDLYYRLSAAVVRLPPLRARLGELPLLAQTFLANACRGLDKPVVTFTEPALARLAVHGWPGNVRELKNLTDYLAATVPGPEVLPKHVTERLESDLYVAARPPVVSPQSGQPHLEHTRITPGFQPLAEANRDFERDRIATALAATEGNKTQAARLLGVPLRTFMEKIKRHGL